MSAGAPVRGATLPGALLRIHALGVLLTGPSGIGKSDAVLGLLARGHALIADDAVEFSTADGLWGRSPPLLRGRLCVRGLGVIDVAAHFGVGALCERARAELWIALGETEPDPLAGGWSRRDCLGIELPALTLPAGRGRDLPLLIEHAVREHRLREQGLRADQCFIADQRAALTGELS